MKKALMNASVASMIYKFNMRNIDILEELGYEVEVACNFGKENPISKEEIEQFRSILNAKGIKVYETTCPRSVFAVFNMIKAYKQLKKLADTEEYDLVHTQSPIGGVICRLAFRKARKKGTKVIYQAHGFHFYKGASLKNWVLFYPIEWLCSFWTDKLITINQEDYALAKRYMHAKEVVYIPGVGIDLSKVGAIKPDIVKKREVLGIPKDKVWILSVGELTKRKNHETLIKAVASIPNVYLTIAGKGELHEYLQKLIKDTNIEKRVKLIGFRSDISDLCMASDVFCFPSIQEGLPVALMEAMACGKPCVVSNIRGNTDLIKEANALFDPHSVDGVKNAIEWILQSNLEQIGKYNAKVVCDFNIDAVLADMKAIYDENNSGRVCSQ